MDDTRLIVNFTPTGMIPTKNMTTYVPIAPEEIIKDVKVAWDIGITMVHLHAREIMTGLPSCDPVLYKEMILGIREFAPELIICVTTSGRTFKNFNDRAAALHLQGPAKPDMGSLTLSSLNFNKIVSVNEPDMIIKLAQEMQRLKIKPELEAFDAGMINFAHYLISKQILTPPYYFNLLLGNIACAQADLLHAGIMVRDLPAQSYWSFAGIGQYQLYMNALSVAVNGGVRIGLEDNIWMDGDRTIQASNASLLERVHRIAEACGRNLMPAKVMREKLGLSIVPGKYGLA